MKKKNNKNVDWNWILYNAIHLKDFLKFLKLCKTNKKGFKHVNW